MIVFKLKIWAKYFIKSYIWIILPICVFFNFKICSSYIEAGKYLTPYSVNVSGYYRSDGTYVRPHNRRPPGSVKHDAPYESKRIGLTLLFIICLIAKGSSVIIYIKMSIAEIERQKRKINEN